MATHYHKINSLQWLDGSIRVDLEPDERSVWADLLALAATTREKRRGYIERSEGVPYKKEAILNRLQISEELYDRAINKCVVEGRLQIMEDGTLYVTNWETYNSLEQYRQKQQARQAGIEAQKRNKEGLKDVVEGLTRQVNRLNTNMRKDDDPAKFTQGKYQSYVQH